MTFASAATRFAFTAIIFASAALFAHDAGSPAAALLALFERGERLV